MALLADPLERLGLVGALELEAVLAAGLALLVLAAGLALLVLAAGLALLVLAAGLALLVLAAGLALLVLIAGLAALARLAAFAAPLRLAPALARCDPLPLAPLRPDRADAARRLPEAFLLVARSAMTLLGVFDSAELGLA